MGLIKKLAVVAAIGGFAGLQSTAALASHQHWDFDKYQQSLSGSYNGNSLQMSIDGINLTVTGWSDTRDVRGDDTIQDAELTWAQTTALGIENRDEGSDSPNHSIDSFRTGGDHDGDSDMLLLHFDHPVVLKGIDLDWARDGDNYDFADVSIAAYDGSGSSDIEGKTWAEVIAGNYTAIGDYGNVGLSYYAVNGGEFASTKWLVGAYNIAFGGPAFGGYLSGHNDGLKLGAIKTFKHDNEVPLPATVSLVLLGLVLLRRQAGARQASA